MTVANDFMTHLGPQDRKVLVEIAKGQSNDEIVATTDLPLSFVESAVRNFREWLRRRTEGRISREALVLAAIEQVLNDKERSELSVQAGEDWALLRKCNLITAELEAMLEILMQPGNFGVTYPELAAITESDSKTVRGIVDPAAEALGSRARLQISYYFLNKKT